MLCGKAFDLEFLQKRENHWREVEEAALSSHEHLDGSLLLSISIHLLNCACTTRDYRCTVGLPFRVNLLVNEFVTNF